MCLLSHWRLPDEEKASPTSTNRLVKTGEAIISDERITWVSTAKKPSQEQDNGQSEGNTSRSNSRMMTVREWEQVARS